MQQPPYGQPGPNPYGQANAAWTPPGGVPPQPPKKKSHAGLIVAVVAIVLVLIVVGGAAMYFSDLASPIMFHAERHDWAVVIEQTAARRETEVAILSGAQRQHSDGLIFQPHALGPGDERYLIGNDRLVILGDRIFHGPVDQVTMANTEAARIATQYLIDRGHRRIAVIGANPRVSTVSAASLRLDGYIGAVTSANLPLRPEYQVVAEDWHLRDGATGMAQLLNLAEPPDAVFCFNDTLAFGALPALATKGLNAPDDVAVIGFDNVPMAEFSVPP